MSEMLIKKLPRLVIAFVVLLTELSATSQVISYSYDDAGNRIRREIVEVYDLKPEEENLLPKGLVLVKDDTEDITVTVNNEIQSICLTISPDIEDGVTGELYSLAGYLVLRAQGLEKNPNITLIDIPKGVYVLVVKVGYRTNAYKVIKK